MMKRRFCSWIVLLLIGATGCSTPKEEQITLSSLLDEMLSIEELAEWPEVEYEQRQISSYDRHSTQPGDASWFANNDGRGIIRTDTINGRVEKVLFEEQNPGVITRIWNTTTQTRGTLRFYFDGHTEPDWVVPAYDFVYFGLESLQKGLLECHTNYEPGKRGGNTFFLPIPYAQGCKVTLEEPAGGKDYPRYHQFNYRRYPVGTPIETFSLEVAERCEEQIQAVCEELQKPLNPKGKRTSKEALLGEKESLQITLPKGERCVAMLKITLRSEGDYGDQMRRMILSGSFDGVQTLQAPLADFSGAGLGARPVHSRYLEADGRQTTISYWPMPYRERAELQLKNLSSTPSEVEVEVVTTPYAFNERTLYFHTSWRQECGLPVSNNHAECRDWDFATLKGRGIYRGDVLTLFNHSPRWYGEGDEKIFVDGEEFPSHFGTGTEDYYNSSWAPVVPFHTAFGGAPRADLASSHGYSSWLRTRSLDAIPFHERLDFDIELISWRPGAVDYATTVYWYGDLTAIAEGVSGEEEATREMPEEPEDPSLYVIAEGALEFEKTEVVVSEGGLVTSCQKMDGYEKGRWSRAEHLLCKATEAGGRVKVRFKEVENGRYRIKLHASKAADYGRVMVMVNGGDSITFDGYATEVSTSGAIDLGEVEVQEHELTVDLKMVGRNRLSKGFMAGLDCLVLEKL